jgi:hypothetical protein
VPEDSESSPFSTEIESPTRARAVDSSDRQQHQPTPTAEAVVAHFASDGLTMADYLRAAQRQRQILIQRPATLIGNLEAVVDHFAAQGLTVRDYLQAAVKQPQLFYQSPGTLIGNIEGVVEHFAGDGLTMSDYLLAAVTHPPLFTMKPATIIAHVNLIESLQRQDLLVIDQGKPALFAFALKHPMYLTLAEHNFQLREIAAQVTGSAVSFRVPRKDVESRLAESLGHADLKTPAPKINRPDSQGADLGPHARNLLLRALIHEGYIKGKTR